MNNNSLKLLEIILGLFNAIVLWIFGDIISGGLSLSSMEPNAYYSGGYSVQPWGFLFPFIVLAVFIVIAKFSSKKKYFTYFYSFSISFFIPFVCFISGSALVSLAEMLVDNLMLYGIISRLKSVLFIICFPLLSLYDEMTLCLIDFSDSIKHALITAQLIPIIVGAVIAFIIVSKGKVKKS